MRDRPSTAGFAVTADHVVRVSERALGQQGFEEWLLQFHGRAVRAPIRETYGPWEEFLDWYGGRCSAGPARK